MPAILRREHARNARLSLRDAAPPFATPSAADPRWFARIAERCGHERLGIDDFRSNGLLLPAVEQAAQVLGLPLHRGPHVHYNKVVMERVGQIEAGWQARRMQDPVQARRELVMRLRLLQEALRRSLLHSVSSWARLNRRDPNWSSLDFTELDAMAEMLWADTEPVISV